jgi:hypothetical protein
MFILTILTLLFIFNLLNVVTQSGVMAYKDVRFWLTLTSLCVVIAVTICGYMG